MKDRLYDNNFEPVERSPFEVASIRHQRAKNLYRLKEAEFEAASYELQEAEAEVAKFYPLPLPIPEWLRNKYVRDGQIIPLEEAVEPNTGIDYRSLSSDPDFSPQDPQLRYDLLGDLGDILGKH